MAMPTTNASKMVFGEQVTSIKTTHTNFREGKEKR
jgi:hypothetical protein